MRSRSHWCWGLALVLLAAGSFGVAAQELTTQQVMEMQTCTSLPCVTIPVERLNRAILLAQNLATDSQALRTQVVILEEQVSEQAMEINSLDLLSRRLISQVAEWRTILTSSLDSWTLERSAFQAEIAEQDLVIANTRVERDRIAARLDRMKRSKWIDRAMTAAVALFAYEVGRQAWSVVF